MAKKTFTISNVWLGVIAIVAGVLVLAWWDYARVILGIFLVVWGILSLVNK